MLSEYPEAAHPLMDLQPEHEFFIPVMMATGEAGERSLFSSAALCRWRDSTAVPTV
jgi:hypothetical protein